MTTATISDLTAAARNRADKTGSLHVTDAEISRHLKQAYRALLSILYEHSPQETIFGAGSLSTVAGTANYTIANVMKVVRVDVLESSSGDYVQLEPLDIRDYDDVTSDTAGWSGREADVRWSFTANGILSFTPVPRAVHTVRYFHHPDPDLSAATEFTGLNPDHEEFLELRVAIRLLTKEDSLSTAQSLRQDLAEVTARIRAAAVTMSSAGSVVRDVERRGLRHRIDGWWMP